MTDLRRAESTRDPIEPGRGKLRARAVCVAFMLSVGVGCALAGCAGDAEGASREASQRAVRVYIEAFSSLERGPRGAAQALTRFQDSRGTVYSLVAAQLGVESIRFHFSKTLSCADIDYQAPAFSKSLECYGTQLILRGPFRADLRRAQDPAERPYWRIPSLAYRRVELRIAPVSMPPSPQRTLQARASFASHSAIRELRLDFRFDATLRASMNAEQTEAPALTLGLDVADWLSHIPVSECMRRGHLDDAHAQVELNNALDAPSYPSGDFSAPVQDCTDALARFRHNVGESLRVHTPRD